MRADRFKFFDTKTPFVIAHRGGAGLWPENTAYAFDQAYKFGCRYFETDVHLTRDGHLVCMHDPTLERTTDGYGYIRDHTLSELKRLDAGYRFEIDAQFPFRGKGISIPTLQEILDVHHDVRVIIEMKNDNLIVAEAVWSLVSQHYRDRVLVATFIDRVGNRFRQLARGQIPSSAGTKAARIFWLASRLRISKILPLPFCAFEVPPINGNYVVITPNFVDDAHALGMQVHAWTIDDPNEMRRMLAMNVDAIITDRPDIAFPVFQSWATDVRPALE